MALALLFAVWRGSPSPIFAGIGAIAAMSRTLSDAVTACLTQIAGITCGTVIGCLFVALMPAYHEAMVGVGIVLVIACCNIFRLEFAVPLSCIVFTSICLLNAETGYLLYGFNRFLDTSIGLLTALAINVLIRPYNNRIKISKMLTHIQQLFPALLEERILKNRYPDLSGLRASLKSLSAELEIFEHQPAPGFRRHAARKKERAQETAYLRGCEQLLLKMTDELSALCSMDTMPIPDAHCCERLALLGLAIPEDFSQHKAWDEMDGVVLRYHLRCLLNAYDYLSELNRLA